MEAGQLHSTEKLQTRQIFLKHLASNMKQVATLATPSICVNQEVKNKLGVIYSKNP